MDHKDFGFAIGFATAAHMGQTRKYTGDPYVVHPIAVAEMVYAKGGDHEQVVAALLHDVVEDTGMTITDIESVFGMETATLVEELTDVYTRENYPDKNRKIRKALEADRLANVTIRAKLIKWCDLADNTRSIVEHDPNFSVVYLREKAALIEKMGLAELFGEDC